MSDFEGLDPDQMDAAAHELTVGLHRVGDALADVVEADAVAGISDLTGPAHSLIGELQEEMLLTVALLDTRADLMRLADVAGPVDLAGRGLYELQVRYGAGLAASLDDTMGSDGAGDEVRRYLEARTWELAGYEQDPLSMVGPPAPGDVDRHYADLVRVLRGDERTLLDEAIHQRFGSTDVGGDPSRLAFAAMIATLIVDVRLGRSGGRYWTTLDAEERDELIDNGPERLIAAFARQGVLSAADLDAFDSANAYDVFSEELKAEFGLEVNVRYFVFELGGDVVAAFTKLSDGSVLVEVGTGVKAGAGLKTIDAKASVGLYMDRSYTLLFPGERQAADAIREVRTAIEHDMDVGLVEQAAGAFSWISRLHPNLPDFHHGVKSEAISKIGELWDDFGSEKNHEMGVYGELEVELRDLGLFDADAGGAVRAGWYETRDDAGNGIESGAVLRFESEIEGDGVGGGIARDDVTVRVFTVPGGDSQLEIQLSAMAAAGGGGTIGPPVPGAVSSALRQLGVRASALVANGARTTVTIRLPLNGTTASAAKRALTRGDVDGLDELYEMADVEVHDDQLSLEQVDLGYDAKVIDIELSTEHTRSTTTRVFRKPPFGEMYSPIDIDAAIEEGRRLAG